MTKTNTPLFNGLLYSIFIVAFLARIILATVNNGAANDDHLEVSKIIYATNTIPEPQACWQCYHPKLYHYTVTKLWNLLKIETLEGKHILAQLINALAGIFTILTCWSLIKKQPFNNSVKLLCFSLVALNPRLIAINAQASNDTFVILFGTVVIYYLYKVIAKPTLKDFLFVLVFSILAGLTKNNSLVLIIGVISVYTIKIISTKNYALSLHKGYIGGLLLYIIITLPTVAYVGEYYSNYKKYNTPVVYNTETGDLPFFYEKTNFRRPGVQSIVGGYFTFRIIDMVKNPIITNEEDTYPINRTSVFSQLYGRSHFVYFDNWPPGMWQTTNPTIIAVGRVALILALFPLLLFLIGLLKEFSVWFSLFFKRNTTFLRTSNDWVFHVFILGFLFFTIIFTAIGRDFSFMKAIYIFPGLLACLVPFLKGSDFAYQYIVKNRMLLLLFKSVTFTLLLSYLIPIVDLILKLAES